MTKQIIKTLEGSCLWWLLKIRDHINYSKIVLVLTGENKEVDQYALYYLDDAIERKKANAAVIYVMNDKDENIVKNTIRSQYPVKIRKIGKHTVECLYKRYNVDKFFENIFWTFINHTKNNLLGRFMKETDINAEDVVCLAIFNFRKIPEEKNRGNVCC